MFSLSMTIAMNGLVETMGGSTLTLFASPVLQVLSASVEQTG